MESFSATDQGKQREMNQDYIFRSDTPVGLLPNLFIVADGMGGYKAGDYASRCCVEEFTNAVKNSTQPTVISVLTEALNIANQKILSSAANDENLNGMGTTLVAATVFPDRIFAMNVGDSRFYLLTEEISQISVDHSYVEEMIKKGEILRKDAKLHPKKNVITRAVGVEEKVEADFYEISLTSRMKYALLCSDGLTNMLEDEEILHIVLGHKENPEEALRELITKANDNGGRDNISAVIIAL